MQKQFFSLIFKNLATQSIGRSHGRRAYDYGQGKTFELMLQIFWPFLGYRFQRERSRVAYGSCGYDYERASNDCSGIGSTGQQLKSHSTRIKSQVF